MTNARRDGALVDGGQRPAVRRHPGIEARMQPRIINNPPLLSILNVEDACIFTFTFPKKRNTNNGHVTQNTQPTTTKTTIQVAGKGQTWVSVGLISGQQMMVTNPPHRTLVYPDPNGAYGKDKYRYIF